MKKIIVWENSLGDMDWRDWDGSMPELGYVEVTQDEWYELVDTRRRMYRQNRRLKYLQENNEIHTS